MFLFRSFFFQKINNFINSQMVRPQTWGACRYYFLISPPPALGVMILGDRLGLLRDAPRDAEEQQRCERMAQFVDAIHDVFKETTALGIFPPKLAKALRLPVWRRIVSSHDEALASGIVGHSHGALRGAASLSVVSVSVFFLCSVFSISCLYTFLLPFVVYFFYLWSFI